MKSKVQTLLFVFFTVTNLSALDLGAPLPLSLENAQQQVLEHSPTLFRANLDLEVALRDQNAQLKSWIPGVSASGGVRRSSPLLSALTNPASAKPETQLWSLSGSVDLRLNWNLNLSLEEKREALVTQLARLEVQALERSLVSALKKQYYQILGAEASIALQEEGMQLAQTRLEQIQAQFDRGLRSDLELLTAKIAASRDLPVLERAKADQEKRFTTLRQSLGLAPNSPLVLTTPLDYSRLPLPTWEETKDKISAHIDLIRATLRHELSQINRELGRASRLGPGLGISLGWSSGLNPLLEPKSWSAERWSDNLSLGLSLSVPLDAHWEGTTGNLALQRLDVEVKRTQSNLEEVQTRIPTEIQGLLLDLKVARSQVEWGLLSLNLQEQNYRKVLEGFERGKTPLLDLENARQELQKAKITQESNRLGVYFLFVDLTSRLGSL